MYYIAKTAQAAGLTVIAIDFVRHFPEYANRNILILGAFLFCFGWIIERYLLKR